ncbi:recombination protein RecT [Gammaproteobacteria bacterium]
MGHAYLIPFSNKKAERTDVQVIIGYRGLLDLARRSGQIVSIAAHVVHESDLFEFEYGLDEKLKHIPAQGNPGQIRYFYAVAKLANGGHVFEVMSRADVETIRDASQNHRSARQCNKASIWDQHFGEMGRKTAIRRLFKYLPVSIELASAIELDHLAESGKPQGLESALSGEWAMSDVEEDAEPVGDPVEESPKAGKAESDWGNIE